MKTKLTAMALGTGLAVMAAGAVAEGAHYPAESGYVADSDGHLFSYVVYDIEERVSVITRAANVNTDGRGTTPDLQSADVPPAGDVTPEKVKVSVGTPDVNDVFGRA